MSAKPKINAIIVLFPSETLTIKELRVSLSKFCQSQNISIIDIINPVDEYDHFLLRRLSQLIKYNTKNISLVTNKSIFSIVEPLALWCALETTDLSKSLSLPENFFDEIKKKAEKPQYIASDDFNILSYDKVSCISDWMFAMQDAIIRERSKQYS